MPKKKLSVATVWLQSCSGCHVSMLDLHQDLVDVLNLIDIKHSPLVDVKEIPSVDVGIVEGAVGTTYNAEVVQKLREKSTNLIALGTCANFGGISGLRNLFAVEDILSEGYIETESTKKGSVPKSNSLPKLLDKVLPVHEVVEVDFRFPGCPPLSEVIKDGLVALYEGKPFELPTHNLCEECVRDRSDIYQQRSEFLTETVSAPFEVDEIDSEKCFLEQGIVCLGPMTREGCGTRCLQGNMPCRGCMGPASNIFEQGAKMIDSLSSILPAGALMFLEDIVGLGYRYSLPTSIHTQSKKAGEKGNG